MGIQTDILGAADGHGSGRARVLVVEDDYDLTVLLRDVLEEAGYNVATARDGETALDILMLRDAAVIIVDLRMPVMDGSTFIHRYRQRDGDAYIIVLTALGGFDVEQEHVDGAQALVRKPFALDDLLHCVSAAV